MTSLYYVEKPSMARKLGYRLGLRSVVHPDDVRDAEAGLAEGISCVVTLDVFNGDIMIPAGCKVLIDPAIRRTTERQRAEARAFLCDSQKPTRGEIMELQEILLDIKDTAPKPFSGP